MPRTMPFGKYKGRRLDELPDDYVWWLLSIDLRPPLSGWIDEEVRRREGKKPPAPASGPKLDEDSKAVAIRLITVGYRKLAMELHPDIGGTTEGMQSLTRAIEALRAFVAR